MARMTKKDALRRVQQIAESGIYKLDGTEDTGYEPVCSNYKTAIFCRRCEEYAERHPEEGISGIDLVQELVEYIAENPDVIYYSEGEGIFEEPAWILKRWSDRFCSRTYLKIFKIESREPIVAVHS